MIPFSFYFLPLLLLPLYRISTDGNGSSNWRLSFRGLTVEGKLYITPILVTLWLVWISGYEQYYMIKKLKDIAMLLKKLSIIRTTFILNI
jgi:hypothetical protein